MKKSLVLSTFVLAALAAFGADFKKTYDGYSVDPVRLECGRVDGWTFDVKRTTAADGVEEMDIKLTADRPRQAPRFSLHFDFAQVDAHHRWTYRGDSVAMPPI